MDRARHTSYALPVLLALAAVTLLLAHPTSATLDSPQDHPTATVVPGKPPDPKR
ncbi:hypothetical protein [Streptomyces sp. NRRL S-350]|uniref:hypothetical protein n=1 Tax=Streptomyces sp. NRRL S-350 TaxID=1463902 RepID=UPI000A498E98|nr:hypothetical protein [Streptomyces sp. NRRL S-350]